MYKKPPDEERTNEYPDIIYPAQRRHRRASNSKQSSSKRPSNTYYADEHPEIPRVKRASLQVDKEPAASSHIAEFIQDVGDEEEDISEKITITDKQKVATYRRPS